LCKKLGVPHAVAGWIISAARATVAVPVAVIAGVIPLSHTIAGSQ